MNGQSVALFCEIDLLCLLLLGYLSISTRGYQQAQRRLYSGFLICVMVCCISNEIYAFTEGHFIPGWDWLGYVNNMAFFLSALMGNCCWFVLSEHNLDGWVVQRRSHFALSMIPLVVITLLTLTTPIHHRVFYIEDGHYYRGDWYLALVIIPVLLILWSAVRAGIRATRKEYYANRKMYLLLAAYTGTLLLGELIQVLGKGKLPGLSVSGTALAFVVHEVTMRQQITQDALTQINNRGALEQHLHNRLHGAEPFYLIMLDLDRFKAINDTYGHAEGDRALQLLAQVLKQEAHAGWFVGRYGGDEFIMVTAAEEEEQVRAFILTFRAALRAAAEEKKLPYALEASMGYARRGPEADTIPDLLKAADSALYQDKHQRKAER